MTPRDFSFPRGHLRDINMSRKPLPIATIINKLYLIIFLFMAIEVVSTYKFFRLKKIKLGIFSLIYFLVTLILTLSFFFSRNVLVENELGRLINGITNINLYAILVLILNIGMIVISIISYVKIMKLSKG